MDRGERARRSRERQESRKRIEAAHAETRRVVESGRCPKCGSGLRRNLSLSGWWQCEQYGAEGFRKDRTRPACDWQGFTD